jgi:hypothetical protein
MMAKTKTENWGQLLRMLRADGLYCLPFPLAMLAKQGLVNGEWL